MKKIITIILGSALFLSVGVVFAQELTLTKVGVLSTVGVDYSSIDYTGAIPTLEGTATPSAQVLIKIKTSTEATVAASPSGVWKFTPGVLSLGSSSIVITSGSQSISFSLNFNATPAATPTATATPTPIPEELPDAGVWEYYLPVIGAGILVLFLGKYIKEKMLSWEGRKDGK
ncbi:MAG: hypothetical protein UX08_C0004G0031 [Candidatus Collierbacteria bacterium GW2011_GWB1_45_35]|uniref:Bacterial Ig-like domain-containing protein n=1 Tax=Candidatus Collierbacteria bacterium GW2011_GWB2_45_17 TaxID=1618388 RepID=A0A837IF01_9BACT|nr:MAG: hypothetical protein UW48_C0002G0069 [Microgenomates group bacterium GW2011_GWC1_44_23]KKT95633.1 MAG: hypothetical protein UW96_C0006G0064 [Candidatus Collierbacteria bacterium GW2011_GWA1_45_15]KKU00467.1 MAG: hypothetical protein UX01_C0004G0034 [Candidatus Collierbacteria bacterium GW2011_GWB2_45_17]KKU05568.1 MAG: hypothetical protein UX08_C0004G0031 [Candidatus Collierbacteria bacterium GW2011_GWB1_45_35]KKU08179.1 MAG: hypothetical protein UX11_C0006G0035 [Candidatus Collierbacte